jgi:hypothetical protein
MTKYYCSQAPIPQLLSEILEKIRETSKNSIKDPEA